MPAPKNAPLYQQIYDEIKDAIEKGVYAPKERIPSELELAEQYDVSRITVRRAVEELCSDGYLVKQQGRGTFVSTPHINRQFHASTLQTFTALCAGNGMKPVRTWSIARSFRRAKTRWSSLVCRRMRCYCISSACVRPTASPSLRRTSLCRLTPTVSC